VKADDEGVIRGEFFTDGKTYILRLGDTPLSGVGATAQEAFENLASNHAAAATLPAQIRALAREQQSESTRVGIIRVIMGGLIAVGIVAGAIITTAAIAPRVLSEMTANAIDGLSPEREEKLAKSLQRLRALMDRADKAGTLPEPSQIPAKQ
jgi:hypothetical protein